MMNEAVHDIQSEVLTDIHGQLRAVWFEHACESNDNESVPLGREAGKVCAELKSLAVIEPCLVNIVAARIRLESRYSPQRTITPNGVGKPFLGAAQHVHS